jgi:hypothetical protein
MQNKERRMLAQTCQPVTIVKSIGAFMSALLADLKLGKEPLNNIRLR